MATANGGDGGVRPRARESEGETGESEREQGGIGTAAGVVHAARRASASRRWPRAREHAAASGRGEEDDGELQCWAG